MRNTYLVGLGGALLATTALSSGASAATLKAYTGTNGTAAGTFSASNISAQQGYTSATVVGPLNATLVLSNRYVGFKPNFILTISGASFSSTSLASQNGAGIVLLSTNGVSTSATYSNTLSGSTAACSVGVLSTQIQINSCQTGANLNQTAGGANASFAISAIALSGLVFTGATGLTTVGSTITLAGSVVDSTNTTNVFESLASTTVVNVANAATVTVSTSTATVNQGTGTTPFVSVSQNLGNATSTGGTTVELAAIYITGAGTVLSDLTAAPTVGALALTVTSAALADPAISNVRFLGQSGASAATATTLTSTATFSNTSLTAATIYGGSATSGTNFVQVEYNGTASITGGVAGTVAGTFSTAASASTSLPAVSGATSAVTRGGFSTQVNSVQASTNTSVTSYIRINNSAAAAGTVTITVYNAATGAQLGTAFTSASIPGYGTLQLSAQQIESSAGFTPTAGQSYTVSMSGTLNGYVQHVTGNPGGLFTDFSGRRAVTTPVNAD